MIIKYTAKLKCLNENKLILTYTASLTDLVVESTKKYEHHPSLIAIKENVQITTPFKFAKVTCKEIAKEHNSLNN